MNKTQPSFFSSVILGFSKSLSSFFWDPINVSEWLTTQLKRLISAVIMITSYLAGWTGFDSLVSYFLMSDRVGPVGESSISFTVLFLCILAFMLIVPHFTVTHNPIYVILLSLVLAGSSYSFFSIPAVPQKVIVQKMESKVVQAFLGTNEAAQVGKLADMVDKKSEDLAEAVATVDEVIINSAYNGITPIMRAISLGDMRMVSLILSHKKIDVSALGRTFSFSPFSILTGFDAVDFCLHEASKNIKIIEPILVKAISQKYVFSSSQIALMEKKGLPPSLIVQAAKLNDQWWGNRWMTTAAAYLPAP